MRNTLLLLKAQLINTYSINEILTPKSQNRKSALLMAFAALTVGICMALYISITTVSLIQMDLGDIIPAYMVTVTSFAILFLTCFKVNGSFFGNKDHEMLMSLPVEPSAIFASRFLSLYILNLGLSLVFVVPSSIVWAGSVANGLAYLPLLVINALLSPIIPMCIASLLGIVIILLSSKFKHGNVVSLILSFLLIGSLVYLSLSSNNTQQDIAALSTALAQSIYKMYPFAMMFTSSFPLGQWVGMLGYAFFSVIALIIFVKLIAPRYASINRLVTARSKVVHGHNTKIVVNTPFMALYKKELKRFFGSYLYMLNSGFGLFTLIALSIVCLFVTLETIGGLIGMPNITEMLQQYAPFAIAGCIALSCPSASSISLEGNNLWVLQASPVTKKLVINSKIAVSLTMYAVAIAVSASVFSFKIGYSAFDTILLIAYPTCYALLTAIVGISLNNKFPNFNWSNEMQAIKQSTPVIISSIVLIVSIIVSFLGINALPEMYRGVGMIVVCAVLLIIAGTMYQGLTKVKVLRY